MHIKCVDEYSSFVVVFPGWLSSVSADLLCWCFTLPF